MDIHTARHLSGIDILFDTLSRQEYRTLRRLHEQGECQYECPLCYPPELEPTDEVEPANEPTESPTPLATATP